MRFRFFLVLVLLTGCSSLDEPSSLHHAEQAPSKQTRATQRVFKSSATVILDHGFFKVHYDPKYRIARYVSYQLTAAGLRSHLAKRRDGFFPDPLLRERGLEPVGKDAYVHSGYDRGHLAPAASFSFSQEANDATFVMSNMAPQTPDLNRHAWKNLEALERRLGCGEERVWVFTGPVLEAGMQTLSDGLPIPKRFFKVVVDDTPPRKAIAFVYSQQDKSVKAEERVVGPEEVERLSGESFENVVPEVDRGIFRKSAPLSAWKQADCGNAQAKKSLTRK